MRKVAEQGYAKAQYKLAIMYRKGIGTNKNPRMAKRWFAKSAK